MRELARRLKRWVLPVEGEDLKRALVISLLTALVSGVIPAVALAQAAAPALNVNLGTGAGLTDRVVQLVGLLTVLSLATSIVIMTTSFVRIIVVLSLLRIAREALNNAVRHAQASQIDVRLALADDTLLLAIADNGIGFDPQAVRPHGQGLHNMRQRAQALGASLALERGGSKGSDRGSSIVLRMPVPL